MDTVVFLLALLEAFRSLGLGYYHRWKSKNHRNYKNDKYLESLQPHKKKGGDGGDQQYFSEKSQTFLWDLLPILVPPNDLIFHSG